MTNERDKQKLKQSKQKQYNTKHDIKDLIVKYKLESAVLGYNVLSKGICCFCLAKRFRIKYII